MLLLLCVVGGERAEVTDLQQVSRKECLPQTVVRRFTVRGVWLHESGSHLRLEGHLPTTGPDCGPSPTFCWSLVHRHYGMKPAAPDACLPQEGPCLHTLLFLHLPPYHLHYGHYTFHLLTNYSSGAAHQCTGGIISVVPAPIRVQVLGHSTRTHTRGLPLVLEARWEDPDLPPGAPAPHLRPRWSCYSTAPNTPGALCNMPLGRNPNVTFQRDGRFLTVARDTLQVGHNYTFSLAVGDERAEMGREMGREMVYAAVVVSVMESLVPSLRLHSHSDRPLPEDRWVLWVQCLSCRRNPVPVYYQWSIIRYDVSPPQEIDWAQGTESGASGGLELTRVEVLPGHVVQGAWYQVTVRGQYQPSTPTHYQYLADIKKPFHR